MASKLANWWLMKVAILEEFRRWLLSTCAPRGAIVFLAAIASQCASLVHQDAG